MMKKFQHQLVVALLAMPVAAAQGSDVFRMFFRYGFEQGEIGDPQGQPTEADVKGLMCATNDFLTNALQNYTKSDNVEVNAVNIDWDFENWVYNGSEPEAPRNVPVIVNFTTQVTTTDDSTPPTNQVLWEATKYFDYFSYIQDYIWKIPNDNFFTEARGLWYEPFIQEPVQGKLADNDQCPAPPTDPGRVGAFELQSERPSTSPSTSPTDSQRATTLDLQTELPTVRPTEAPIGRNTVLTLAPTLKEDEMVYFTVQVDFFAGREREPTDTEIEKMMCQTNKFFEKTLKEKIDPNVVVYASNIDWEWDDKAALPSMVEFFADARYADGKHVPAEEVFNVMEQVDVKQFVQDYVWMSETYKENVFYQTEDIFFAGSYTGSPNPPEPHPGKVEKFNC